MSDRDLSFDSAINALLSMAKLTGPAWKGPFTMVDLGDGWLEFKDADGNSVMYATKWIWAHIQEDAKRLKEET